MRISGRPKKNAISPRGRCQSTNRMSFCETLRRARARLTASVVVPTPALLPNTVINCPGAETSGRN